MAKPNSLLKTMKAAVSAGVKAIAAERKKGFTTKEKSPNDFVTSCDIASEQAIIKVLKRDYPDSSIFSEEIGTLNGSSNLHWIIDPLDGTHNFIHNIPFYGISIAAQEGGEIVAGIIHLPELRATYHAVLGKGAFLNEKKINVSNKTNLSDAFIAYDSQFEKHPDIVPNLNKLFNKCFTLRISGSAAVDMAKVSDGSIDARIFHKTKEVDFAAGYLIVKEAGGKITNFSGEPINLKTTDLIVSNGKIHNELVQFLSKK